MSTTTNPESRRPRRLLWLLLPAVISAAVVFLLWRWHPEPAYWKDQVLTARAYLEANPVALILVLATLPGLGVPISPLLMLAGVVLGPRYGLPMTCFIAFAAQLFCSIWTYGLAVGPLRGFLKKHFFRRRPLPDLSDRNALRLGFIVRMTPGLPYFLQNIALGVMGLRFSTYLIVSIPVMLVTTVGFVVTGGALFKGKVGLALTGVLLVVVVILVTRLLRSRTANSNVG